MPTVSHVLASRSLPKISTLQNGPISSLQAYGSLLFVSSIIAIVILANIFERWLLRLVYGEIYVNLQSPGSEKRRRSFTYYHVGAVTTFVVLCIGIYPAIQFIAGPAELSTKVAPHSGSSIQIGDLLFIIAQMYSAYYAFELCYRTQFASPLSIAHHIGLLAVMQTSLSLFGNWEQNPEASIEFYMCMVWGTFDAVVELPIYISMIIWRVKRNNHRLLAYLTAGICAWVLVGAFTEVAVTIYLLHKSWERWGDVWKFVTPFIFSLWIATQLYGASRLFIMSRSEWRKSTKGASPIVDPIVLLLGSTDEADKAGIRSTSQAVDSTSTLCPDKV